MSCKVLVTGGAGYLGSTLVPYLLQEKMEVTVLDRFMFHQNSLLDCCSNPSFHVIRGDCRDQATLKSAIKNADIIIPLAAIVGAPLCKVDAIATQTTNFDAIKTLLSLRSPDQFILYPCTNSGYGVGEQGKFCDENTPLRPISLYGKTKVDAEQAILDAGNSISLRLATVFGISPRMRLDLLVNDFVHRAFMDRFVVVFEGHFKRNYIHVRDVARGFLHGINNFNTMKNQAYNLGLSSANLSKLELCDKIKTHLPEFVVLESPIGEDPDKRDYIVSNEKIEKTGYQPVHDLDMGIQELIKGYTIIRNAIYGNV